MKINSASICWLLVLVVPITATRTCFTSKDSGVNRVDDTLFACTPDNVVSACCNEGDLCLSNGLCEPNGAKALSNNFTTYFTAGCTDSTYSDASCIPQCHKLDGGMAVGMTQCPDNGPNVYCCFGLYASGCSCDDAERVVTLGSVAPSIIATIPETGGEPTPSTTTTISTTTSGVVTTTTTNPTTAANTVANTFVASGTSTSIPASGDSSSHSSSTSKLAIGLGVGLGLLLVIVGIIIAVVVYKKRSNRRTDTGAALQPRPVVPEKTHYSGPQGAPPGGYYQPMKQNTTAYAETPMSWSDSGTQYSEMPSWHNGQTNYSDNPGWQRSSHPQHHGPPRELP